MTSKSLSSNPSLILDAIKKKIWVIIVTSVCFFLAMPVGISMGLQNAHRAVYPQKNDYIIGLSSTVQNYFSGTNVLLGILAVIAGLVVGLVFFSYLHDKKQVDFFHSLPISGRNLFFVNYFAGLLSVVVPFIIFFGASVGVVVAFGDLQYLEFFQVLKGLVYPLIFFISVYTFTVLAAVLTGNIIVQGCVSLYGLMVFPVAVIELQGLMSLFFKTYDGAFLWLQEVIFKILPIFYYFMNYPDGDSVGWGYAVIRLAVALVVLMAAAWLYTKRQGESAGKAIAFSWFKPLVKYPLIILGSVGFALLFYTISGDDNPLSFWLFFGAIIGAVLISRLLEMIFAFDVKAIKTHWLSLVASLAVVGCIFGAFALDLGGYDSYVPNIDDVAEANIKIGGLSMYGDGYYGSAKDYGLNTFNGNSYLQEKENIKAIINIAQNGADNAKKIEVNKQVRPEPRYDTKGKLKEETITNFVNNKTKYETYAVVSYILNNGKTVTRNYPIINKVETVKDVKTLINSEEYRQKATQYLNDKDIHIDSVTYADTMYSIYKDSLGSQRKLITAYKKDIQGLNVEAMGDETVVGVIQFNGDENPGNSTDINMTAPIFKSYTNTLNLLKKIGYDIETYGTLNVANISKITKFMEVKAIVGTEYDLTQKEFADVIDNTFSDYQLTYNYFTVKDDVYNYTLIGAMPVNNLEFTAWRYNLVNWNK
ncbi:MAG: DUF6449 domain-containing protein [Clostridiales bacterium]